MLPVLSLHRHANECCGEYLPLVFAQVLMWSSLVLFLPTCNTWDSGGEDLLRGVRAAPGGAQEPREGWRKCVR